MEAFTEEKTKLEDIMDHVKQYIGTSFEIVKLRAIEKGVTVAGSVVGALAAAIMFVFALLFISTAIAFAIGHALNNNFYGFIIVGCVYLVGGIIVMASKASISTPVSNALIKQIFKDDKE